MKKIKLLILPSDGQGVGHFRSIWPAQSIEKHYSDEIEVEINRQVDVNDLEYLKRFDIIHFHRVLGTYENMKDRCDKLRELGVKLIMDIDDYWEPPMTHPLYELVVKDNLSEKMRTNLSCVDYVTTTTKVFADYIRKINPNVYVIPNALDMSHKMWNGELQDNPNDICRISWIGGSSHLFDLKLLIPSMTRLHDSKELIDKFQIVMCGFDIRGTITEIGPNGEQRVRKIQPYETIWMKFEEILTNNYSSIKDKNYLKWLKQIKKEDYLDQYNQPYVRRWTLPLTQYGKHYDYCDVCLAPLEDIEYKRNQKGTIFKRLHIFNAVKSELKIIEAGMKKKALIAQDFGIYKSLLKNNVTGILVSDNKDGWYKAMKKIILDKDFRQEITENLHNFVKDKYELKNVTAKRVKIYKEIMKNKVPKKLNLEGVVSK